MTTNTETKKPAFVLLDQAGTDALIAKIKTAGTKLDGMIQQALQCGAIHAHKHSDAALLQKLLDALPKGSRSVAVKDWMVKYAPVGFENQKLVFNRPYDNKDEVSRSTAISAVESAIHWTECKPEAPFVPFDLDKALTTLLERAEKALKDEENKDLNKVDAVKLAKLKALM